MDITLLIRLIAAHLLSDFILQPDSWIKRKNERKGKSLELYLHGLVTAGCAYVFSGLYTNWLIPLIILITHTGIDYLKSQFGKGGFRAFFLDQLAHICIIIGLWLGVNQSLDPLILALQAQSTQTAFWLIATAYLAITWPLGLLIGVATQGWRDQILKEESASKAHLESGTGALGLDNAGKWIGICERVLILTFVLLGQYTAIGFLITAKSILRFSEKEGNTQLKTEYVLVGTLLSFALAALIGVLVRLVMP